MYHHRKELETRINARRSLAFEVSVAVSNLFSKDPSSRYDLFPPVDFGADNGVGDTDTEEFVRRSLKDAKQLGISFPPEFGDFGG